MDIERELHCVHHLDSKFCGLLFGARQLMHSGLFKGFPTKNSFWAVEENKGDENHKAIITQMGKSQP